MILVVIVEIFMKCWFVVWEMIEVIVVLLILGGFYKNMFMVLVFLVRWCRGELGVSKCCCLMILLMVCG